MSTLRSALTLARKRRAGEDHGFSLMETMVAMLIFSIFMITAMGAIVSIMTSTQKSQSLTDGAAQLENAFQRLDHQVRYADSINVPGLVGTNWYVEWHTQATSTQPQLCAQLKLDTVADKLMERTWIPTASPVVATSWILVAKNVVNTTAATQAPFTQVASQRTAGVTLLAHQQLLLDLLTQPGGSIKKVTTSSETTTSFTALNSTTQSGLVCQEVARS